MPVSIAQRLVAPPSGYMKSSKEVHTVYPKYVHFPDGSPSVIVQDAAEEKAVLAGGKVSIPAPPKPRVIKAAPVVTLVGVNDEKEMLLKIASEKKITVDRRWGLKKLRVFVETAFNSLTASE